MIKLTNGKIVDEVVHTGLHLYVENGVIVAVTDRDLPCKQEIDVQGAYIAPGFVDVHTHGAGGHDFMDGTLEDVKGAAKTHLHHGTTTLLPTMLSCGTDSIRQAIGLARQAAQDPDLPHIPGVHLEGPYFSPKQAGAQQPEYLTPPIPQDYTTIVEEAQGFVRRWSFAPELEGSVEFCRYLVEHDIEPSVGHSDAEYTDVLSVYQAGCRTATHLYSGMSTIVRKNAFRVLGVVESAYLLDDMIVEVIADGCHLPPELLRMIYKIKGADHVCLVTDSMRGAGMPDGPSVLGRRQDGLPCVIEDGVAKMMDRKAFAGSVATFDRLVRVCYKKAGIPLADCVKMASTTPAALIGLGAVKGRLQPGYDADLVMFDEDVQIQQVWMRHGNDFHRMV